MPPTGHEADERSRTFRRRGVVTARRRDHRWAWSAEGQLMSAEAGDWDISDEQGRRWSAKDEVFRATYEPAGPARFRCRPGRP